MSRKHTFPEQKEHALPEQKAENSSDTDSAEDEEDENQQSARIIRQKQGPSSAPLGSGAFGSSDIFKQPGSVCLSSATGPHAIWHPVWIKLDSGSDFNLISGDVLKDMNFDGPYEEPKSTQSMTLDEKEIRLEQRVKLRWGFHKSMKLLNTRFYTVENAPFDVLIGKSVIANRDLIDESRYLLLNLKVFGRNKGQFQGVLLLLEVAYKRLPQALTISSREKKDRSEQESERSCSHCRRQAATTDIVPCPGV